MEAQVTLKLSEIMVIVGSIAVPLSAALGLLYRRGEARNKTIVSLTESCLNVSKDLTKAVENNTKVIEKLPEQFILQLRANGK
jgi:membrane-bound lytic murein transglycosylase MltF